MAASANDGRCGTPRATTSTASPGRSTRTRPSRAAAGPALCPRAAAEAASGRGTPRPTGGRSRRPLACERAEHASDRTGRCYRATAAAAATHAQGGGRFEAWTLARTSAARLRARRRASVRRDRRGCTPGSRSPAARRRAPRPSRFRRCWLLHPSVLGRKRGAWRFLEGAKTSQTSIRAPTFLQPEVLAARPVRCDGGENHGATRNRPNKAIKLFCSLSTRCVLW